LREPPRLEELELMVQSMLLGLRRDLHVIELSGRTVTFLLVGRLIAPTTPL
jgi:hypothetical protein